MAERGDRMLDAVRGSATAFRAAIERCDRRALPIGFECFPRGSCGDTTLLLGTYLTEQGLGAFEYVYAQRGRRDADQPTWQSHAWLRQGPLIVDITADQFPEVAEPVIVTSSSSWHETFQQEVRHSADFRIFDEDTRASLDAAFRLITAHCGGENRASL
jgi:hypothetical protein